MQRERQRHKLETWQDAIERESYSDLVLKHTYGNLVNSQVHKPFTSEIFLNETIKKKILHVNGVKYIRPSSSTVSEVDVYW